MLTDEAAASEVSWVTSTASAVLAIALASPFLDIINMLYPVDGATVYLAQPKGPEWRPLLGDTGNR